MVRLWFAPSPWPSRALSSRGTGGDLDSKSITSALTPNDLRCRRDKRYEETIHRGRCVVGWLGPAGRNACMYSHDGETRTCLRGVFCPFFVGVKSHLPRLQPVCSLIEKRVELGPLPVDCCPCPLREQRTHACVRTPIASQLPHRKKAKKHTLCYILVGGHFSTTLFETSKK